MSAVSCLSDKRVDVFNFNVDFSSPRKKIKSSERSIPSRESMHMAGSLQTYDCSSPVSVQQKLLMQGLFGHYSPKTLHYREPKKYAPDVRIQKLFWEVPQRSMIVLDAPGAIDDFYYNNLDWGQRFVFMNLDHISYAYDPENGRRISFRHRDQGDNLSAIKGNPNGDRFAYGDSGSSLGVIDLSTGAMVYRKRNINGHPVHCIDWRNFNELTVGTDGHIAHIDLRSGHISRTLETDIGEVCSLKWHVNQSMLATGNACSRVRIFDMAHDGPGSVFDYSHQSGGVKALQWNPSRHSLLMSGGGKEDHFLKIYDVFKQKLICEKLAGSQVCGAAWLDHHFFVVGLGWENNQIQYWQYSHSKHSLQKVDEVDPKSGRVLDIAKDPLSSRFCSLAAETEQFHFWEPKSLAQKTTRTKFSEPFCLQIR